MTLRQKQQLFRAIAVIGWCGAVIIAIAAVWFYWRSPPASTADEVGVTPNPTTRATGGVADIESAFNAISKLDLRRPLSTALPAAVSRAAAPTTAPASAIALALKGTILDSGGPPYAVFIVPGGATTVAAVNDRIEGAEVIGIGKGSVTLRYGEGPSSRIVTLLLPTPKATP